MQRDFQFHACLGSDVSQRDIIQLCGIQQLLEAALAGYNVTIFAYGQTGGCRDEQIVCGIRVKQVAAIVVKARMYN